MTLSNQESGPKRASPTCMLQPTSRFQDPPPLTTFLFSVNAADSDITFESSDNALFHVNRKNIEAHAAGFPPAEIDTCGETIRLTEDSTTLELLFAFMYPRRHPNLDVAPFEHLASLAEAAEKYEVFSLMDNCQLRMRLGVFHLHHRPPCLVLCRIW